MCHVEGPLKPKFGIMRVYCTDKLKSGMDPKTVAKLFSVNESMVMGAQVKKQQIIAKD